MDKVEAEARARQTKGGAQAGRGRPKQVPAKLPEAISEKSETREIIANLVSVGGRTVSDALLCWERKKAEAEAIMSGKSKATVSGLAGKIRREQAEAQVKVSKSDITTLRLTPEVGESGEYLAKFHGVSRSGKGLTAAWLVMLNGDLGLALLLQKLPDDRQAKTERLPRATPLGTTVTAITGETGAEVDVRPYLGVKYRLSIEVKGKSARIVQIKPETEGQAPPSPVATGTTDQVQAEAVASPRRNKPRSPRKTAKASAAQRAETVVAEQSPAPVAAGDQRSENGAQRGWCGLGPMEAPPTQPSPFPEPTSPVRRCPNCGEVVPEGPVVRCFQCEIGPCDEGEEPSPYEG